MSLLLPKPAKRPPRAVRAVGQGALEDQADALWSKAVKKRDGHRCVRCGSRKGLESAHGLPRTYRATRWELRNGLAMCWDCHRLWAHRFPHEFTVWFQARIGARDYVDLYARAQSHAEPDLAGLVAYLKRVA